MYGKLIIRCSLEVLTGMHIGDSAVFSAIGAVDSPVIRDRYTGQPIVPGSSLKGKLRTLLARSSCRNIEQMPDWKEDTPEIQRLFGSTSQRSLLQFADAFLTNAPELSRVGMTEVKMENSISRRTSVANPRQIERVIAGARFGVSIVYDVTDINKIKDDLELLAKGMKLLQMDYLGGHGSRGSGRVSLKDFKLEWPEEQKIAPDDLNALDPDWKNEQGLDTGKMCRAIFGGVESYELIPRARQPEAGF